MSLRIALEQLPTSQRSVFKSLVAITLACVGLALSPAGWPSNCRAAAPRFPWHGTARGHAEPATGGVPVKILPQPATTPVDVLSPKQAYPYGWFGSNPSPHWKRSFGTSKAYTQWSRY